MRQKGEKWKEVIGWAAVEGQWLRRKHFSSELLSDLADRIKRSELGHTGELMAVVEAVSPAHEPDSSLRALEVFGRLRVWDTPMRTGVLLYLALDRHHIEIVADRGIAAPDTLWAEVCHGLQERFKRKEYAPGLLAAVEDIEKILIAYCPPLAQGAEDENDLPNEPVFL